MPARPRNASDRQQSVDDTLLVSVGSSNLMQLQPPANNDISKNSSKDILRFIVRT